MRSARRHTAAAYRAAASGAFQATVTIAAASRSRDRGPRDYATIGGTFERLNAQPIGRGWIGPARDTSASTTTTRREPRTRTSMPVSPAGGIDANAIRICVL